MKMLALLLTLATAAAAAPVDDFITAAATKHGAPGQRAAEFLVKHMPETDKASLSAEFLTQNLDLAFQARAEFPWAKAVPEEIFFNDVLPYAVFDETREPWRAGLYERAKGIVKDCKSASEAAQALNRELFNQVKVHYNTARKRANQSPGESMEIGMASCSGLSILLVDACRAVGVPARAVGIPVWTSGRGNHTWVEIWDGDWFFTGADEYDKAGLNRGWFVEPAGLAREQEPEHSIYATSWTKAGTSFPLVWAPLYRDVAAVNVTARYARKSAPSTDLVEMGVRLFSSKGGQRLVATVRVVDETGKSLGEALTKAGTADLNDMPSFKLPHGTKGLLHFTVGNETRQTQFAIATRATLTVDAVWDALTPAL